MSPITKEIKKAYEYWKINSSYANKGMKPCEVSPLSDFWMYYYLFPEILLVADEYLREIGLGLWRGSYNFFPCKFCSEEQVLRIMAEHGIL